MNATRGRLDAIWVKRSHRGPMDRRRGATLRAGKGIEGNADQEGRRQVTLIDAERWWAINEELGADLDPSTRRANFLVSGISLAATRGRVLRVGSCRLRILGETRPCERMEESFPGLREAMQPDWGGGAFAEVLDDGSVEIGDTVCWLEE